MQYQLIYSSQATEPMSLNDLEGILAKARTVNEASEITGVLVYVDGAFLQILEGDKDAVQQLMRRIALDTRHSSVTVFHEGEVPKATFGSWRMAFLSATPEQLAAWAGVGGATSLEAILEGLEHHAHPGSQVAESILAALAQ